MNARHCERVGQGCRCDYRGCRGERCVMRSRGLCAAVGAEVFEELGEFWSLGDGWPSVCLI